MTGRQIKRTAAIFLIAAMLISVAALAQGAGEISYRNEAALADNLKYINTITSLSTIRTESFALEMAAGGEAYPIVMAADTIYGSLTMPAMISYAESRGYNVLAAINSDFFSPTTGVPIGLVIEDGVYKSSSDGHNAFAIGADGTAFVSQTATVDITLVNEGSPDNTANMGKAISLRHFNKMRQNAGLYLFSSAFSTVSTRTTAPGWFVRMKIVEGAMSVSGTMRLKVEEILESAPAQPIGDGYLLLTAADTAGLSDTFKNFAVGDNIVLNTFCSDERLASARWATGGGDILVSEGVITDSVTWDTDISFAKHPRTAVGIKADGSTVYYVVDGRKANYSGGLTLKQLAEEMIAQGCIYAMNFDGGGSSVMSVKTTGASGCSVINAPSDGTVRKCAAYILIVTDKVKDGQAKRLALKNDGAFILAGSSAELQAAAADGGFGAVALPAETALFSSGLGNIEGMKYTAGPNAGIDTITLKSNTASGSGSLHILTKVDSVSVKNIDTDKAITSAVVKPGETLKLKAEPMYLGRSVLSSAEAFTYAVSGDVGAIDAAGVFTAAQAPGKTGTVTVSGGGVTVEISIKVRESFEDTKGHWGEEYIEKLLDKGIVAGTSGTTFSPNKEIKRGDFILMLYRAAGQPATQFVHGFADVPETYYSTAIAWAAEKGIALGNGDGTFTPEASLTRQQAFTFVHRALKSLGISTEDGTAESIAAFTDAAEVADYAVIPTATLIKIGAVQGAEGKLTPRETLTRAQMAKILYVTLYGAL